MIMMQVDVVVPKWARYMAQDSDGEWYWYQHKPRLNSGEKVWLPQGGESQQAYIGVLEDYKNSLHEIVTK